jgi:hypothetical protein
VKLETVKNAVTSKAGRQILLGKKHSPAIMFGAGVVGTVGTVILACRATLKVEEVLDEADKKRVQIKTMVSEKYSEKDRTKDNLYLSFQTIAEVTKLYAPAIGLGVVSVGLLTGSHITLSRRNVAITAAYKAVEESFESYRGRAREILGEEKERELYRGVESVEIHDTKKGSVTKRKFINPGSGPLSPYSKYFDEHNVNWKDMPEYNMLFLRAVQNYANQRLNQKGYVLLNDVYDDLGMDRTKEGCVVGWLKKTSENQDRDGYVDIGVFDSENMDRFYDFIVGDEGIWLDFNVDGVIYDKI